MVWRYGALFDDSVLMYNQRDIHTENKYLDLDLHNTPVPIYLSFEQNLPYVLFIVIEEDCDKAVEMSCFKKRKYWY